MQPEVTEAEAQKIEAARRVIHKAQNLFVAQGMTDADIAVASIYASFDAALITHDSNPELALGWIRQAADVMEEALRSGDFRAVTVQ